MVQKSADAFRTISEVATTLELPAHVLRFWESRFSQIKPVKRGGGRRYYRPQDIRLLRGIRDLLYSEGESIKDVQKILREKGVRHVVGIGALDEPQLPVSKPPPKLEIIARKVEEVSPKPTPEPEPKIEVNTATVDAPHHAQFDLFEDYVTPAPPKPAARTTEQTQRRTAPKSTQREIRVLLGQLIALRDTMKAQD